MLVHWNPSSAASLPAYIESAPILWDAETAGFLRERGASPRSRNVERHLRSAEATCPQRESIRSFKINSGIDSSTQSAISCQSMISGNHLKRDIGRLSSHTSSLVSVSLTGAFLPPGLVP